MPKNPGRHPKFLQNSFRDIVFYSLMVGVGETYLAAYALALGLTETQSGIVTVGPMLVGSIVQLYAGIGARLLSSRRKWVCACALAQALSLFALGSLAFLELSSQHLRWAVFAFATTYWASAFSAGPSWNIWISKIVPTSHRISFFSARTQLGQVFVLIGLITAGTILNLGQESDNSLTVFAALFVFGGTCRLASGYFIWSQDDQGTDGPPVKEPRQNLIRHGRNFFRQTRTTKMVGYLFLLNLTVYTSAPFFNPYMLKQLKLGFFEYSILISASFMGRIVASNLFVSLAKRYGVQSLLYAGAIGIAPLSMLWIFYDGFYYLLLLQIMSGFAWGSHELGVTLVLLEKHSEKERSSILTLANLFNSTAMYSGGLIGAQILRTGGVSYEAYHQVFLISTILRLAPLSFVFFIEQRPISVRAIYSRILSIRPGGGSIVRPILYTDEVKMIPPPTRDEHRKL